MRTKISEEFLEFKDLERTMGAAVSAVLLATLEALNIPIKDCYGQGYDCAASMSSKRVGVQQNILAHAPKHVYVHCASHCLNFITSHACSLQSIWNMVDRVKQVCIFFNYSPKRNHPRTTSRKWEKEAFNYTVSNQMGWSNCSVWSFLCIA